jgi:hypothetical protein
MLTTLKKIFATSKRRFGYYLNHTHFHSLLYGVQCPVHPQLGTHITKCVRFNATSFDIMMFDIADSVAKSLGQPWTFSMTGSYKLVK